MERDFTHSSLEILYSISRELATTLEMRKVLAKVLTLSTEKMNAERASLVVLNAERYPVDAAIIYNGSLIPHTVEQMHDVVESGLAGWVIRNLKPALIANTQQDERWLVRPNQEIVDPARSALCVPLMSQENLVGVLTIVHRNVNFFTDNQYALQQAIADMAGIAIRNAQLYQEVEEAQRRYQDLFEESMDPVFVSDMHGKIIEANQKSVHSLDLPRDKVIGSSIFEFQDVPEGQDDPLTGWQERLSPLTYESILMIGGEQKNPIEVHVSTIMLQGTQALLWIIRDISERKRMETLREDLAAMIYHDLRSPLSNIVSSLDLMKGTLSTENEPATEQLFEICDRSTARMQRLISSLLDVNRLETGQPIANPDEISVEKVIDEAVEALLSTAASKEVGIEKMVLNPIPPILADEDMVRRVLINLLENAIKFSLPGDKAFIGAKQNKGLITVWVEDHGPGIPETAREQIFNKFVRLHGEGFAKGLGLGLAFCRLAVEAHGGKIWVENINEGGSRFILTLPAAKMG